MRKMRPTGKPFNQGPPSLGNGRLSRVTRTLPQGGALPWDELKSHPKSPETGVALLLYDSLRRELGFRVPHRQSLTQAKCRGDRVPQPSPGEGAAVKAAVKGPESHYHLPPTVPTAEGPQGSRPLTGLNRTLTIPTAQSPTQRPASLWPTSTKRVKTELSSPHTHISYLPPGTEQPGTVLSQPTPAWSSLSGHQPALFCLQYLIPGSPTLSQPLERLLPPLGATALA